MTLNNLTKNVIIVGITKKEYVPKGETEKKAIYNLGICTETGETGMIRCAENVAVVVEDKAFKRFTEHEIICSYNDQYNRFMVDAVK